MLSLLPREGAGRWGCPGARAFLLPLALAASLAAAPATPPPTSPAADPVSAKSDPDTLLQRLAEEAERIDPASPDALTRLRTVVRELIKVERADRREIAALRSELASLRVELSTRGRTTISHRRSRSGTALAAPSSPPALGTTVPGRGTGTPTVAANSQASGPLFGKRGLKKVHRAGCVFGERIHTEDRVFFHSIAEAAAAGYEPCKICRPGG